MRRGAAWSVALVLGSAAAGAVPRERAPGCTGPRIVLEGSLSRSAEWSEAAEAARQRVAELSDVDACAVLRVTRQSSKVALRVRAGDGRSAVRELARPQELGATAVALLVLPPTARDGATSALPPGNSTGANGEPDAETAGSVSEPSPAGDAATAAAPSPRPPRTPEPLPRVSPRGSERAPLALAASSAAGFELGLAAAGRSIGALRGPGASALGNLRAGGWLFGLGLSGTSLGGGDSTSSIQSALRFSLSPEVGHRFGIGSMDLDLGLEAPGVMLDRTHFAQAPVAPPPTSTEMDTEPDGDDPGVGGVTPTAPQTEMVSATAFALHAGAFARLSMAFARPLRAYLELDGGRTLYRFGASRASVPELAAYDLGASLGVAWSPK